MNDVRTFFEWDRYARTSGIELVSVGPGEAVARMAVDTRHLNGLDVVQGGAIFTLADFAFAAAANSHGTVAVAIQVSIHFVKAARSGTLTATARELARNPKLGSYQVDVTDDAGDRVALFQGLAYRKQETVAAAVAAGRPSA